MTQSSASLTKDLWNRIESFDIDGEHEAGCAFPFADRLARENSWSITFARRVVMEYKRFVYLAMTAGHPVTPSDQVDQAWHLHLTYTRSYWQRLCGEVLPRPLHHEPTRGGESENVKFDDWYARTKKSYTQHFGSVPPADIWPDASIRFGDDLFYERINTRHNIIVSRGAVGRLARVGALTGVVLTLAAGCTPLMLGQTSQLDVGFILILMLILIALCVVVAKQSRRGRSSGCGGSGCSSPGWFGSSGCGSHGSKSHDGHGHGDASSSDGSSGCASSGCGGGGCGGGGD